MKIKCAKNLSEEKQDAFQNPRTSPKFEKRLRYQICIYVFINVSGLKMNQKPAFAPISEDFMINWKNILRRAEYSLVQLLLTESQKVIKKLDSDIENELRNFGYESRDQVYLGLG